MLQLYFLYYELLYTYHTITIRDIETNITKGYTFTRSAARELQISHSALLHYIYKNKLYKDKYTIEKKNVTVQWVEYSFHALIGGDYKFSPGYTRYLFFT